MPEKKKKSGLHKDLSSIFKGLEEVDNGRGEKKRVSPPPEGDRKEEKEIPAVSIPVKIVSEAISIDGSFPPRRNARIGLDIGRSSIKLMQIYPTPGGWEIGGYALQEIRLETDEEGLEKKEYLLGHLKEIIAATKTKTQVFTCSLRGGNVNTSLIPLARMPKKELESACRLEAKRRVSFNVDKAFIQTHLIPGESDRPGGRLNYLVTVSRRETISRRLSTLQEAGLQVSALLPLPFAWPDLLSCQSGGDSTRAVAIVDVGSDRTLVSIYKGSEVQFSREFETGGDHVTEAIIQAGLSFGEKVEISWEEAESLKKEKNLLEFSGGKTFKNNLSISHIVSMVRPILERIVQESKRSLDYYGQLFPGREVNQIYLSGGGALLAGLVQFFQERMRAPVELLRLPDRVSLHPSLQSKEELEKTFPRLAKVAALSLNRKWEVNFIPPLDKILQKILRSKVSIIIIAVVLFGISFLFYRSKAPLIPAWEGRVAKKQEQLNRLNQGLKPYDVLAELKQQLAAREKLGQYSSLRQPNWKGVLKELSYITPDDIIVSQIYLIEKISPLHMVCEGRVVETKTKASLHSAVTDFIGRVENSPFFQEVKTISEDAEKRSFSFSCTLVY